MESSHAIGYTRCVGDRLVTRDPAVVFGVQLLCNALGGDVALYNGRSTGGDKVATFKGPANRSWEIPFPHPVLLHNGIYIDVGSNVDEVTVFWDNLETFLEAHS